MKRFFVIFLTIIVVMLAYYKLAYPTFTYKYRMTVETETSQEIKSVSGGNAGEMHSNAQPVYADQIGNVVRLADERNVPFQFSARTVSDENVARKYGASVSRFPSIQDCLIKTERDKTHPDLTMVDWSKIRSTQDADVCFFRVASSYASIDTFQAWLEFQGFEVTARFEHQNADPMGAWIGLSGSRNHAENNGRLFSVSVFQKFLGQDHSMSVFAQFDHTDNVIGIQTAFNTK